MKLLQFLYKEAGAKGFFYLLLGLISGLSNASIIKFIDFIIKEVLSNTNTEMVNYDYILLFMCILVISFLSQRYFAKYLITLTQTLIFNIRFSILQNIRNTDYLQFQQIGRESIYTSLTQDTEKISAAAASIVYSVTYLVTIVFCLGYLAYISWVGFALTLLIIALGILVYSIRQKKIYNILSTARDLQNTLFKYIDDLLLGFKEIKISKNKNDDLFENHIKVTGVETQKLASKAISGYLDNSLTGQFFFFILIGFVLFYFPSVVKNNEVVLSYIFIILYILGPIEGLMAVVPAIAQADIALDRIYQLQKDTEKLSNPNTNQNIFNDNFTTIEIKNAFFDYPNNVNHEKFEVGPINFTLQKGEMVFIVGGNGSGKTTFLKMFTGLYFPSKGEILVDNESVKDYTLYRNRFTTIFGDFHLFDKLFGLQNLDSIKVNQYLNLMQLSDKIKFENDQFYRTELSTGQKKRLALIIALLENKPIIILDEWAADQDPQFRAFFYHTILPDLKKQGKTIIAITHDDKYFEVADKVYKMEYGNFSRI